MDSLDQKIFSALRKNARIAWSDLALTLGVARGTIRERVAKMEQCGKIQGYTTVSQEDLQRSPIRAQIMVRIQNVRMETFVNTLRGWPEIHTIHSTSGQWDFILEVGTDTLEELDKVISSVRMLRGVVTSETSLLMTTW